MRIVVDIETDGLLRDVSTIHCIVAKDIDTGLIYTYTNLDSIENRFPFELLIHDADLIIGHNFAGYDAPVLKKLWDMDIPSKKIFDTMLASLTRFPHLLKHPECKSKGGPHTLANWGAIVGIQKVENDEWDKLSDLMVDRCKSDVEITHEVYKRFTADKWDWSSCDKLESAFSLAVAGQEIHGWEIDVEGLNKITEELKNQLSGITGQFNKFGKKVVSRGLPFKNPNNKCGRLSGAVEKWYNTLDNQSFNPGDIIGPFTRVEFKEVNLSSPIQRINYLNKYNWVPTEFSIETGKPKMTRASVQHIPGGVMMADYTQVAHRIGFLEGLHKSIKDNKTHAGGITCGTNTGRVRHSTVVNVPHVGSFYGDQIRSLFCVRDGYSLVGCDLKAIESRILGHFTHPHDGGEFAKRLEDEDFHTTTVTLLATVGVTRERGEAKNVNYALMYGARRNKIASMLRISLDKAEEFYNLWWEDKPALLKVRGQLESSLIKRGQLSVYHGKHHLSDDAWIRGVDGRKIFVRSPHSLLNALIQSTGSVIHKMSVCLTINQVKELGLDAHMVGNFHDETQFEVLNKDVDKYKETVLRCVEETGERLNLNVKIEGDVKIGTNWKETH